MIEEEDKHVESMNCSVYWKHLSHSPGFCVNLGALLFAATPFLLLGYLRLFIASWSALPLS